MRLDSIKSAVVTGPTGAIGSALCAYLIEKGACVYAIVRPESRRLNNLPEGVTIIPCDLRELFLLKTLIPKGIDAFFHLAWTNTIGPGRDDMQAQTTNIFCAIDAVRAASDLDCKVFVGVGSQAEYGRVQGLLTARTPCFPENGYGMAKLCAGQMTRVECKKYGIRYQWVRVLSVYGPNDGANTMISSVIGTLLHNEKPALTAGIQKWDYLYATDAAIALYRIACNGHDGKIYPLGSGKVRPIREYVEILRDCIDPSLSLGFGEIPYNERQVMHLQADISELQQDTGFIPIVTFERGIRDTIEVYRKQHMKKENK